MAVLPETEKTARSIDTINLAHADMAMSDAGRAEPAFTDTLRLALEAGNGYSAVTAIFYQARLAFLQGRLQQVREICAEGREMLTAHLPCSAQDFPASRGLEIALSCLYLERNDLTAAEQALERGLDVLGWASWMEVIGYANLARLREIWKEQPVFWQRSSRSRRWASVRGVRPGAANALSSDRRASGVHLALGSC